MDEFASAGEALRGVSFAKMTGSGNDFVFFDGRTAPSQLLTSPHVIAAICNRYNGIGADGIVILDPLGGDGSRGAAEATNHSKSADAAPGDARIRYFNSDGSPADLCGNATLCSTRLAVELGMADAGAMTLLTPAGAIASRLTVDGPEIDLQPVRNVALDQPAIDLGSGEQRSGFAVAGIPHLVVLCDDADAVDLEGRGPLLRRHPALGPPGANVNWVSARTDGTWRYRTFERGVEGETLACGTGAVATAVLLQAWGLARGPVTIRTSSGRDLAVRFRVGDGTEAESILPSLRGEGRVVYRGHIGTLVVG